MNSAAWTTLPPAQKLKAAIFPLSGHKHGTRWYMPYRVRETIRAVAGNFNSANLPNGYGRWLDERIVEYPWLFSRLPDGAGKMLDAGSVLNFDYILRHPKIRQKELTIMTLAPEEHCFWNLGVSYVFGDLRSTCFQDNYFDYIVSISTIEHIGLDNTLLYTGDPRKKEADSGSFLGAVQELRRVLKPGGRMYLSVPFGKKDVRNWLQVFDREMVDAVISSVQPRSYSAEYFRYSSEKGWQVSSPAGAEDARYFDFRQDKPWDGHPVAAEAIACLELQK